MFEDKDYPIQRGGDGEFKVKRHFITKEGDIFTQVEGWKYPYRGFPMDRWVDMIAVMKGIIPAFADFIKYSNKFFLIFQKKAIEKHIERIIEMFGKTIANSEARPLPQRYCKAVREVNRVMDSYIDNWVVKNSIKDKVRNIFWIRFNQFKYLVCTILEWDNAYRYRFQDIVSLIDKVAFLKNPRKETNRLLAILIERENHENMKEQWRRIQNLSNLFFFAASIFFRKYLDMAKEMIMELDIKQLKFEEDDEYWCDIRKDYNFRNIDHKVCAEDKKVELKGVNSLK